MVRTADSSADYLSKTAKNYCFFGVSSIPEHAPHSQTSGGTKPGPSGPTFELQGATIEVNEGKVGTRFAGVAGFT